VAGALLLKERLNHSGRSWGEPFLKWTPGPGVEGLPPHLPGASTPPALVCQSLLGCLACSGNSNLYCSTSASSGQLGSSCLPGVQVGKALPAVGLGAWWICCPGEVGALDPEGSKTYTDEP
jgi:hypothetical protein